MRKTRGMAPAGGAVREFLLSQELSQALRPHLAKVHWAEVVGPQVAGVTQVEAVRDGVLTVRVKNSVWANELTLLKEDMLRRLNAKLGGRILTGIHFKASGLARAQTRPAPPLAVQAPTEAELAKIAPPKDAQARVESALRGIQEDALRGRIRRAMLRAAQVEEWKRRQGWLPCLRCKALSAPTTEADAPVLCDFCRAIA